MQKLFFVALLIAVAHADDDAHAHVAKDLRRNDGHGHFEYGYDLTNGIGADEAGDEHAVHGEYHFTSKDGVPVKVSYTADEHGYHPHGDLLPTPPPTPAAILKALKYIESHPNQHHQDGHYHGNDGHQRNVHHETHHNSHAAVQHNVHNAHHDSQRNRHPNTHHNTHQNVHHNVHHDAHHHASHH